VTMLPSCGKNRKISVPNPPHYYYRTYVLHVIKLNPLSEPDSTHWGGGVVSWYSLTSQSTTTSNKKIQLQ